MIWRQTNFRREACFCTNQVYTRDNLFLATFFRLPRLARQIRTRPLLQYNLRLPIQRRIHLPPPQLGLKVPVIVSKALVVGFKALIQVELKALVIVPTMALLIWSAVL